MSNLWQFTNQIHISKEHYDICRMQQPFRDSKSMSKKYTKQMKKVSDTLKFCRQVDFKIT